MISEQSFFTLIPTFILLGTGLLPGFIAIFLYKQQTKKRKSPLNNELLRSPGETLREKCDEISDILLDKVVLLFFTPVFGYSGLISNYAFTGASIGTTFSVILIAITVGICIWQGKKMYDLIIQRNKLRLGYDCEVAVGQGLAQLAKYGFNIFHDFPATKDFNIDHIAVGPQGVFAVETKGRAKFSKTENENWKLRFDGEKLIFPEWTETRPVEQARRQAKWLSQWIDQKIDERVHVIPVLSIPGWFIEFPRKPSDIRICNSKNFSFLLKSNPVLSDKQIKVISSRIEDECRTVQGTAYKK